jgi:hypothetical protein
VKPNTGGKLQTMMTAPVKITDHTLEVTTFEGDVTNTQAVSSRDDGEIVILKARVNMTKTQALVHAAWIVACADTSKNFQEFRQILKAVLET